MMDFSFYSKARLLKQKGLMHQLNTTSTGQNVCKISREVIKSNNNATKMESMESNHKTEITCSTAWVTLAIIASIIVLSCGDDSNGECLLLRLDMDGMYNSRITHDVAKSVDSVVRVVLENKCGSTVNELVVKVDADIPDSASSSGQIKKLHENKIQGVLVVNDSRKETIVVFPTTFTSDLNILKGLKPLIMTGIFVLGNTGGDYVKSSRVLYPVDLCNGCLYP